MWIYPRHSLPSARGFHLFSMSDPRLPVLLHLGMSCRFPAFSILLLPPTRFLPSRYQLHFSFSSLLAKIKGKKIRLGTFLPYLFIFIGFQLLADNQFRCLRIVSQLCCFHTLRLIFLISKHVQPELHLSQLQHTRSQFQVLRMPDPQQVLSSQILRLPAFSRLRP